MSQAKKHMFTVVQGLTESTCLPLNGCDQCVSLSMTDGFKLIYIELNGHNPLIAGVRLQVRTWFEGQGSEQRPLRSIGLYLSSIDL